MNSVKEQMEDLFSALNLPIEVKLEPDNGTFENRIRCYVHGKKLRLSGTNYTSDEFSEHKIREIAEAYFHEARQELIQYNLQTLKEQKMSTGYLDFDSTSDDRKVNNVVRHEYRVLSDTEKAQMKSIKDYGAEAIEFIDTLGEGREYSIAKTKIEEAVMWAVKGLTK